MNPKVSVIMSVYNGADYLDEAISSILGQSFKDFEFIIINDASTDGSMKIIESYKDPRIRIVINSTNQGLTKSLNIGLRSASGEYIARMDADDFSYPNRIERQVLFLEKNREILLCGAWGKIISNEKLTNETWRHPTENDDILYSFLFHNPFIHTSVMFRSDLFRKHGVFYNEELRVAQDYDYFIRASEFGKLANIAEVLVYYRVHQSTVKQGFSKEQKLTADNLRRRQLDKYQIQYTDFELDLHNKMAVYSNEIYEYSLNDVILWINKIHGIMLNHYQSYVINLVLLNFYNISSAKIRSSLFKKLLGPTRLDVDKPGFYYFKHIAKIIQQLVMTKLS